MRKAIILVPLVLFGFGLALTAQDKPATAPGSPASAATALESELRTVIEQYFAAYQKKDLEAMMAVWSSQSPSLASGRQEAQEFLAANENIRVTKITISEAVFEGPSKGRLRVSSDTTATDVNTRMATSGLGHMVHLFDLVKESDKWKIWQDTDLAEQLADGLVAAASEEERSALLKKDREVVAPRLIWTLIGRGYDIRESGKFTKAIEILSFAEKLAEEIGDEANRSNSYRAVGMVYVAQGDYRQARDWLQKSVDIAQKLQNPRLIAVSLGYLGEAQSRLGEHSSALESYQKALEIAESIHAKFTVAVALTNLGILSETQGDLEQAEKYFQRVLPLYAELGDQRHIGVTQIELANIAGLRDDYSLAMEYLQKALPRADHRNMWIVLNSIGNVLEQQGEYESALGYYRRSLEISEKLNRKDTCWTYLSLGSAEMRQNDLDAALIDFSKGLQVAEETGDKHAFAALENETGRAYIERGDYKTALAWVKKSAALAAELGDKYVSGRTLVNLSVIYRNLGEFDPAIEAAERASGIGRTISSRQMVAEGGTEASKAYRRIGKTAQARKALQEAIDSIESIRFDVAGGEQQRQRFFEQEVVPYQEMVDLLISQNQWNEAFVFAERAKGRVLVDVLSRGKLLPTKAMTEAERLGEQRIEVELTSLNVQIQQAERQAKPDQEQLALLKAKLDRARTQYEEFQINLYAAHPELKIDRAEIEPLTLDQAAELLPDSNCALLEFLAGEKQSYLFVVTRSRADGKVRLKLYPIRMKAQELVKNVEAFRKMLAVRDPEFRSAAQRLYGLLLRPAERILAGKKTMIIVPDGALWNLPFQALLQSDDRYLVERYAIGYVPSLTVLQKMVRKRKSGEHDENVGDAGGLLAMADPVVGTENMAHASIAFRGEKLEALPDARREVQAIKQFYRDQRPGVYVGEDAREDRFKMEAGRYRVLHLASHGILDNANPMYSNVLLAGDEQGREDGMLEAREIMQMDLQAKLAVLSACETARGRIGAGEGVIGLSWAFFIAGTSTTVVSQWKVESSSTAELMPAFHRALKTARGSKESPFATARALQQAEVQLIHSARYAHPFYWAGFVVVGNPN